MAFRLYRTTRRLFGPVEGVLRDFPLPALLGGSPTLLGLSALYGTGLVLLGAHPTQVRISTALPARGHDALHRLLRTMPLSTRGLMAGALGLARALSLRLGTPGYLCVDEVELEKAFAKQLPWAAWTWPGPTRSARSGRCMASTASSCAGPATRRAPGAAPSRSGWGAPNAPARLAATRRRRSWSKPGCANSSPPAALRRTAWAIRLRAAGR